MAQLRPVASLLSPQSSPSLRNSPASLLLSLALFSIARREGEERNSSEAADVQTCIDAPEPDPAPLAPVEGRLGPPHRPSGSLAMWHVNFTISQGVTCARSSY